MLFLLFRDKNNYRAETTISGVLESIKEADGDVAQIADDVLGRGSKAEIEGTGFRVVVVGDTCTRHAEGEDVEPGFQGDVAVQLAGYDGEQPDADACRLAL